MDPPWRIDATEHQRIIHLSVPPSKHDRAAALFDQYARDVDDLHESYRVVNKWIIGLRPVNHRALSDTIDQSTALRSMRLEQDGWRVIREMSSHLLDSTRELPGVDTAFFDHLTRIRFVHRILFGGRSFMSRAEIIGLEFDLDRIESAMADSGGMSDEFKTAFDRHVEHLHELCVAHAEACERYYFDGSPSVKLHNALRDDPDQNVDALVERAAEHRVVLLRSAVPVRRANEEFARDAAGLLPETQRAKFVRLCDTMLKPGYAPVAELEELCERAAAAVGAAREQVEAAEAALADVRSFWARNGPKAAAAHRAVTDVEAMYALWHARFENVVAEQRGQPMPHTNLTDPAAEYRALLDEIAKFVEQKKAALRSAVGERVWRSIQ